MEPQELSTPQCGPEIGAHIASQTSAGIVLRELVRQALKRTSKERQQVASELSIRTGERVTKRMLDDWASPSKKGLRFPASLVKGFCEVTGDDSLALAVVGRRLCGFIELGDRLSRAASFFKEMQAIASVLRSYQRRKRTGKKRIRKA